MIEQLKCVESLLPRASSSKACRRQGQGGGATFLGPSLSSFCIFISSPFLPPSLESHSHHDCSMNNRHYSSNLKNPGGLGRRRRRRRRRMFKLSPYCLELERPCGDAGGRLESGQATKSVRRAPDRPELPSPSTPCMAL